MRNRTLLIAGSFFLFAGCVPDKVEIPGVEDSEEYFPLSFGRYIVYQVDSIVFDDAPGGNTKDTVHFELREEIDNFIIAANGDTVFYIHRYKRYAPGQPWVLKDVWTSTFDENNVLRTEENLTFRKMTFPLYKDLKWKGTSYINPDTEVLIGTEYVEPYEEWDAGVLSIDQADSIGIFHFPVGEVMQVSQANTDDGAMKRFVHETYVRGIGLVARTDTILDSRCLDLGDFGPCLDKPWTVHAGKGYILSQVMTSHN